MLRSIGRGNYIPVSNVLFQNWLASHSTNVLGKQHRRIPCMDTHIKQWTGIPIQIMEERHVLPLTKRLFTSFKFHSLSLYSWVSTLNNYVLSPLVSKDLQQIEL